MANLAKKEWNKTDSTVFWGEMSPSDHLIQIYESDEVFLDLLEGFVVGGFKAKEAVIIIATTGHLSALHDRLQLHNFDLEVLKLNFQYLPLDAQEILDKFMVNRWPDEQLFKNTVLTILNKAKRNHHTVRAFGEMVALLWAQGLAGATVYLEQLWNKFCETQSFCLFCAYPKSGFTKNPEESLMHICGEHSKIIAGYSTPNSEVHYQPLMKITR